MYIADLIVKRLCATGIGILVALAMACTSSRGMAQSEPPKQAQTKGSMRIHVVDSEGQPIPKARIDVSVWTEEKQFRHNRYYVCDADGQIDVELPKTLEILRVWARMKGYVPLFAQWWPKEQADGHLIPEEFTYHLQTGTVMGGFVKNEDGNPIKGAKVEVMLDHPSGEEREARPYFDTWLAQGIGARFTDAEGLWSVDNVPPGDDIQVRLKLSHPDYINDQSWGDLQKKQNVMSPALRGRTATIVMRRGVSVTGKVTDPEGQPVKDAVVIWGDDPYFQTGSQEVRTNAEGIYRFPPLPTGPMRVTVAAQGWMPELRKIEITPGIPPVNFPLKPGKTLRVRFVDSSGTPVPDVGVSIDRWRGIKSLYNHKHPNVVDTNIPQNSNDRGIYAWTWAPDDAVTYRLYKNGFGHATVTLTADDSEQVQTIHPLLRISGTVTDAATGAAIDEFQVVPVIYFTPDFPFIERQNSQRQKAGKFSIEFDRTDIEHGVQIEAPGYVTVRSVGRHHIGEADPTEEFRLQPTDRGLGQVLDHDGKPLVDARVYVATGFQQLDLYNLKDRRGGGTSNYCVNTDDKGAFEIAPQMERYALVVISPDGYAEVERQAGQKPGELRIQRWAKLTGKLMQAGMPVPSWQVWLSPIRNHGGEEPRIDTRFQATTEVDGSFTFDRVPPIPCHVEGFIHFSVDSPLTSSRSVPLRLAPGEDAHVTFGDNGIEVTGQLVVENQPNGFDYHFSLSYLVAKRAGIEPPVPLAAKGFDWRKGWSDSWTGSQEGRAYLNTLHNWFVKPAPDGRFRISGVEPGEYDFAVNLYGTTEGCLVHPIAMRLIRITVSRGESTLDLGKVSIPSLALPKIGDVAADFEFVGLDGTKTSLAALRGKYVLVDFWATWCGPCVAKLDEVERIRKQFHADDRLVVVGVNLDPDQERAREFLKGKTLPWHHALVGEWSSTDVPSRFAISSVPTYVLIDPDGRIMAQENSLESLEPAFSKLQPVTATAPK